MRSVRSIIDLVPDPDNNGEDPAWTSDGACGDGELAGDTEPLISASRQFRPGSFFILQSLGETAVGIRDYGARRVFSCGGRD